MRTLANVALADSVADEEILAAGAGRAIRLLRVSVTAATRVIVKVGDMVIVDQDLAAGKVLSENYRGRLPIEPADAVTVTTEIDGTGTTRVTVLGD